MPDEKFPGGSITLEIDGRTYGVAFQAPAASFATTKAVEALANELATALARTILAHYARAFATTQDDVVD